MYSSNIGISTLYRQSIIPVLLQEPPLLSVLRSLPMKFPHEVSPHV